MFIVYNMTAVYIARTFEGQIKNFTVNFSFYGGRFNFFLNLRVTALIINLKLKIKPTNKV